MAYACIHDSNTLGVGSCVCYVTYNYSAWLLKQYTKSTQDQIDNHLTFCIHNEVPK